MIVTMSIIVFDWMVCPIVAQDLPKKDGDRILFIDNDEEETDAGDKTSDAVKNGMFNIETKIGTQKVIGNAIPLIVTITPTIDSKKAQVVWDVPRNLDTENDTERWYTMVKGVPRSFSIEVTPKKAGRYVVVVDVTAWRYDTNYVGSSEIELVIDDELHISPAQEEYQRNRLTLIIELAIGIVIGAIVLFLLIKFAYEKYRQWMSED